MRAGDRVCLYRIFLKCICINFDRRLKIAIEKTAEKRSNMFFG